MGVFGPGAAPTTWNSIAGAPLGIPARVPGIIPEGSSGTVEGGPGLGEFVKVA